MPKNRYLDHKSRMGRDRAMGVKDKHDMMLNAKKLQDIAIICTTYKCKCNHIAD
jgi:hypothetical protein